MGSPLSAAPTLSKLPVSFRPLAATGTREHNFVRKTMSHIAIACRPGKLFPPKRREGESLEDHRERCRTEPGRFESIEEHPYFTELAEDGGAVERILARCTTLVAVPDATPTLIAGFAVTDAKTLFALYVVQDFRHMGLGRTLLARAAGGLAEHALWSPAFERIRPPAMTYRPQRLWEQKGCT